jgi:hypothetical protein
MEVGIQRHASAALPPGKTQYRRCVGPRTGLEGCGKSLLRRDSIPVPSHTHYDIPAHKFPRFTAIDFKKQFNAQSEICIEL